MDKVYNFSFLCFSGSYPRGRYQEPTREVLSVELEKIKAQEELTKAISILKQIMGNTALRAKLAENNLKFNKILITDFITA